MSGITSDFFDVNKILKHLLDDDEINDEHQSIVYVHQFSYQFTAGRVFNILHVFNSGSLPTNVALMQLTQCIMACKAIGSQIMGLVCDSAGSMQRLFRYLCKNKELPEDLWLPISMIQHGSVFESVRSNWMDLFISLHMQFTIRVQNITVHHTLDASVN